MIDIPEVGTVVQVDWRDHQANYDWHGQDDGPGGMLFRSWGVITRIEDDWVSVAQDLELRPDHTIDPDGTTGAEICLIRAAIVRITELKHAPS